jgi:glycosyltransferase involved in cell wall biosynthesis
MSLLTVRDLPPAPLGKYGWPWTEESAPLPGVAPDGRAWPRVTIVTPSYNQGHFIEETIRSVLLQGYPNLEYIVVDGGSTDDTVAILQRYDTHLRWLSEADEGQSDAINKGLSLATGAIQAYLNSDDTYLPGAIQIIAAYAMADEQAGLIYGDCRATRENGEVYGLIKGEVFDVQRLIMRGRFVPQQAAFWRREAMEQVGPFDATLHYCMDHDFFIRVGRAFPAAYIPQPLANFRFHGTSKSVSDEERHWRECLTVSERYGLKPWTAWYWIRRIRHYGLRFLPWPLQKRLRQRMARPHDTQAWDHV